MTDVSRSELDDNQEKHEENNNDENEDDNNVSWLFDSFTAAPANLLEMTSQQTVVRVYRMARIMATIFHRHNLRYWSSGGTTLGIVRHGGLIPWDDDVDICVMDKDEELLSSLTPVFSEEGYTLQREKIYSWKLFPTSDSSSIPNEQYSYRYPFTDIFIMSRKGNKVFLRDKSGRNAWPNEYYSVIHVEEAKPRSYGDFTLNCPLHPEEYLDRTYGDSWRSRGKTHFFCHKTGGIFNSTQFTLEENMLKPALPFK